jgi:hypothetical protein
MQLLIDRMESPTSSQKSIMMLIGKLHASTQEAEQFLANLSQFKVSILAFSLVFISILHNDLIYKLRPTLPWHSFFRHWKLLKRVFWGLVMMVMIAIVMEIQILMVLKLKLNPKTKTKTKGISTPIIPEASLSVDFHTPAHKPYSYTTPPLLTLAHHHISMTTAKTTPTTTLILPGDASR